MRKIKLNLNKYAKYEKEGIIKYIPKSAGYFITRNGVVLRLINARDGVLSVHKSTIRNDGFLIAKIYYEDNNYYECFHKVITTTEGKNVYVAKLVLEAFVGKKEKGMYIRYKDGNRLNCNLDNLEYVNSKKDLYDRDNDYSDNYQFSDICIKLPSLD